MKAYLAYFKDGPPSPFCSYQVRHEFDQGNRADHDMLSFLMDKAKNEYLGLSMPRNLTSYEKLGFRVIGEMKCYVRAEGNDISGYL